VPPAAAPHATLEIASMGAIEGELLAFHLDASVMACDVAVRELELPESASIALIVRGPELVAARGSTVLQADDQVYVCCRRPEDRAMLTLLFGRADEV
jgi:cell volume regulation protein A